MVSAAAPASAAEQLNPPRARWSFSGMFGMYDRAQLQRGFQVYKEVCSACHSIGQISFRNLSQPGGPEFPADQMAQIATDWQHKVREIGDDGQPAERAPRAADRIPGPPPPPLTPSPPRSRTSSRPTRRMPARPPRISPSCTRPAPTSAASPGS